MILQYITDRTFFSFMDDIYQNNVGNEICLGGVVA